MILIGGQLCMFQKLNVLCLNVKHCVQKKQAYVPLQPSPQSSRYRITDGSK